MTVPFFFALRVISGNREIGLQAPPMADALEKTDKLITRATAAISEAKRLTVESYELHRRAEARIRRLYFRASFHPKTIKLLSSLDFPDRRRPYRPFPTGGRMPHRHLNTLRAILVTSRNFFARAAHSRQKPRVPQARLHGAFVNLAPQQPAILNGQVGSFY